jgi:hypothetical protein
VPEISLQQKSANYDPWAKFRASIPLHIVYGYFHALYNQSCLKNLKYLVSGPLQKKFTDPGLQESNILTPHKT